jgi:streptogramin lyase
LKKSSHIFYEKMDMTLLLKYLGLSVVLFCAWFMSAASALDVQGRVVDEEGKSIPFVRIRFSNRQTIPYSTTVFTRKDGTFSANVVETNPEALSVDAFRIGWKETDRTIASEKDRLSVNLVMEPVANVADQVPGSAWLRGDPDSMAYHMSTLVCSHCHQLGSQRVRSFSSKLASIPVGERAESWLKRAIEDLAYDGKKGAWRTDTDEDEENVPTHARAEAWENMVQYMRWVTMRLGEEKKLRWGLEEGSEFYNALLEPENSLFPPRDMEIIIPYLTHNFPVNFDTLTGYNDLEKLGKYGVSGKTVVEEYILPTFGWTREIAIAPGSSIVWFVETDKDRLGGLNPADGTVTWYDVPEIRGVKFHGPHTINADAEGNLWVALEDSFYIARFNTRTHEWRLYAPPEGKQFGVTHDFAYNSNRHVEPDSDGRIWITDLGMNELWGINTDTGDINTYRLPLVGGETHFHSLLYGAAVDVQRERVWWSQVYGFVGSFDTEKNIVERIVPFERGSGPRRLAIQEEKGILWIPLFGSSELVKLDTESGLILGRYKIPDVGAAPYGITLDKGRNAIWAATSNSDRIYRFDIEDENWRHYPMPRQETYIRMIEVDEQTGDIWTTYSSLPVGKRDPETYGLENANNIIVRLVPGD